MDDRVVEHSTPGTVTQVCDEPTATDGQEFTHAGRDLGDQPGETPNLLNE